MDLDKSDAEEEIGSVDHTHDAEDDLESLANPGLAANWLSKLIPELLDFPLNLSR